MKLYDLPRLNGVLMMSLLIMTVFTSCKSRKLLSDSHKINNSRVSGSLRERYAQILGVAKSDIQNESLYRFIDKWIGVPHQTGGMDKKGVDCSGFAILLEKEIYNQLLPRVARQMAEQVKRVYEDELQEGDLVFFDFEGQKYSHVGVYLHNNKFVHASTSKGVIISDLKDPWYYKYFSRAGSIKSLPLAP
jgi:cell wall-associated NlpC family hydrolase